MNRQEFIESLSADQTEAFNEVLNSQREIKRKALEELANAKAADLLILQEKIGKLESELKCSNFRLEKKEPSILDGLGAAFESKVPENVRPLFLDAYATVRVLVEAGKIEYAKQVISRLSVPKELQPVKDEILALLG